MVRPALLSLLLAVYCGQALALQRCVDKAGKVSYSDQLCTPDQQARRVELSGVGSASSRIAVSADNTDSTLPQATPTSPADDRLRAMKGYLAKAEHERMLADRERKRDSLAVSMRDAERQLSKTQDAMDAELEALRTKKGYARNNLAGATWESSISGEMSAIAQRYDTKLRMATEKAERLRTQLASME